MTDKGKLQIALERARLRRVAQADAGATSGHTRTPSSAVASALARAQRKAPAAPMPALREVRYDSKRCAASRILIPEAGLHNPGGIAAYRMLRTRVLHRMRTNQWTSIGITSPGAGDGKSVTTLNLALAIAREKNNNVFLIDLDMRNPKMCDYLGVTPPADITDYFLGQIGPADALFSIGVPNLALAGTRTRTDQASELLAGGRVEELFAYIREISAEPMIVLDLPPILATDDALVIAPKVDACLLVLSEGRSRRDGAAKALELLTEFNLAGIVLNRSGGAVTDYYGY